ncbi:GNAT family N-acetyltransferase [Marilutibacter maris]|uniref:GNAT family N-acetyltransferase n=1 Tax=Marilutibacter maris TaxID=1605891 RepID=UPI001478B632
MTTTIRRATLTDLDMLVPLFDAYRRFYGQPGDLPRARGFLQQRLQQAESTVLLAYVDEVPAGFVQLYPSFSSVRTARVWILNDLYVDPAARRRGVARALLETAERFAREGGASGLMLETSRDNAAARALYREAGWHEEATQWYALSFDDAAAEESLFVYGTLQDAQVQRRLFGRTLSGSADALPGYRLDWLELRAPAAVATSGILRHPIIHASSANGDRVAGMRLQLSAVELAHADAYEGDDYRRVRVTLASGAQAWAYAAPSPASA